MLHAAPRPLRLAFALLVVAAAACSPGDEEPVGPDWLVIGVDGADWATIHELWEQDELPALRGIAERGVASVLKTSYGASPVIWTSVATGVVPQVHGITGFAVPTPDGDVPVSSRVRKVPALWNMLTTAGRRTSVVSWWASWPAEVIDGVIISDRAELNVADAVSPPELAARFAAWQQEALAVENDFDPRVSTAERDHVTTFAARRLLDVPFDLALVYFRGVDIASHRYWKYHQPEKFPEVSAAEAAEAGDIVASTYRATDAAIGRLLEGIGPRTNVMVLSDHGFHAMKREEVRIMLDFDRVLERLGYQKRAAGAIDWSATRLYTFASAKFRLVKRVRFAPDVAPAEREALRARLTADLAEITYQGGEAAFNVRDADGREARTGADFIVDVLKPGATTRLRRGSEIWPGLISEVSHLSGTHSEHTHGVLFAAGPDVEPGAALDGIHILDITPTLLYGLGLPVGEDFAGRPWTELFTADFRARRPLRTVPSWGTRDPGEAPASPADEEILDDLRALGYIE